MSGETETVAGALTPAQQLFNQAVELEKQLRSVIQLKGPLDPNVWDLHSNIRENYETIIFEDHQFAEVHDVEQVLWRFHYKQIEEFRNRIRKSMGATAAAATSPMPGSKCLKEKETVNKLLVTFKGFLSEATGFYHELILKLRTRHGLPQDPLSTEGIDFASDKKGAAELKRCQLSCHRCLIYLGDLARYKELHGDADTRNHDWSVAAGYYLKAIFLWPASGNPHNQLAVLAMYVGDELLAVYRYFRSLAVETAFLTARDNLILLFEKNRQQYPLDSAVKETNANALNMIEIQDDKMRMGDSLKLAVEINKHQNTGETVNMMQMAETRKSFRVRFVRLHGILYTKTSLETFPEVFASTVHDLDDLLSLDDASLEAGLGSDHHREIGTGSSAAAGAVQLVCILIFTVHNVNANNNLQQPTYAEVLQRNALLQHGFAAAFECSGRLMHRCVESKNVFTSPLLPAMLVFMEWLACRPEIDQGGEMDDKQTNAREFFWRQCVMLLNKLCENETYGSTNNDLDNSLKYNADVDIGIENECCIALWEDYELQGFAPLIPAQMALDYSNSPLRAGMGERKERQVRVWRLLAAGRAIVNALDGTRKWIAYDEVTKRFCMAGELLEKKSSELRSADQNATAELEVRDHHHFHGELSGGSLAGMNKETQLPGKNSCVKSDHGEEDDEEIVFKPVPKDISVLPTGYTSTIRESETCCTTPSNGTLSNVIASGGYSFSTSGIPHEQAHAASLPLEHCQFSTSTISEFLLDTRFQKDQIVSGVTLPPSQTATGISDSTFNTTHFQPDMQNSFGMFSSGLLSSVQQAELQVEPLNFMNMDSTKYLKDWLSGIADASSSFISSPSMTWDLHNSDTTFNGGPMKANSAGVIGQHKQTGLDMPVWNTEADALCLGALSNLSISRPTSTQQIADRFGVETNFNMDLSSVVNNSDSSSITSSLIMDSFPAVPHSAEQYLGVPYPSAPLLPDGDFISKPGRVVSSRYVKHSGFDPVQIVNGCTKDENFGSSMLNDYVNESKGHSDTIGLHWAKENLGTSWMGPPPGFGPLPLKSGQGRSQVSSKPVHQVQKTMDGEDPLQVDDYAWLDGYTSSRLEPNNQRYQDPNLASYSSDYGIWPTPTNSVTSSEDTGYPFPGMGISQFYQADEQRQRDGLAMHFSQQLLREQQAAKGFDYVVDPQALQLGSVRSLYEHHQSQTQQQMLLLQQLKQQELYMQYHTRDLIL